jgi:hypothetical protein
VSGVVGSLDRRWRRMSGWTEVRGGMGIADAGFAEDVVVVVVAAVECADAAAWGQSVYFHTSLLDMIVVVVVVVVVAVVDSSSAELVLVVVETVVFAVSFSEQLVASLPPVAHSLGG